jgi:c-di-GMP-binding flagellar brake protein YcgR
MPETQEQERKESAEKQILLEEARLQIGDLVSLQEQSGEAIERYSVRLLGMSPGRSVLVTAPMIDGKYLLMREGQAFIMRAFSGKSAYAFSTQILKTVNTPYPYLHLAYPREVSSLIVRKGARADVRVICAIADCNDVALQMSGTIVNLSAGGAQIAVKQAPGEKGQRLVIKFKLAFNGIDTLLKLAAVIRAVNVDHAEDTDASYQLGVQFVDLSAENSIPLMAFVYRELLEQSVGA